MKSAVLALACTVLFCCAALTSTGSAVFENPKQFLGQKVVVCGWLSGSSNITERHPLSSNGDVHGLSIRDPGPLHPAKPGRQLHKRACLEGVIVYIGCGERDIICVDWNYPYGIDVKHVDWKS